MVVRRSIGMSCRDVWSISGASGRAWYVGSDGGSLSITLIG